MARQLVKGGLADCALALGFEKMQKGSLGANFMDREQPTMRHFSALTELYEMEAAPPAPQMFGMAGREHMEKYGSKPEHFAWIGYKNHKHSVNNPYSQFQDEYTLEEIQNARVIYEPLPLTLLQCSPTSDGSGAAIIASERFVDEHDLWDQAVEIVAQHDGHRHARVLRGQERDQRGRRQDDQEGRRRRSTRRPASAPTRST